MENLRPVIEELEKRREQPQTKGVDRALCGIIKLIKALEEKAIPPSAINEQLKSLNNILNTSFGAGAINNVYRSIVSSIQKEYKLVTPGYYQTLWMSLGMAMFGIPFGTMIFAITGNVIFIAIGIPIGMSIGTFVGMLLDKKAMAEGRALVYQK